MATILELSLILVIASLFFLALICQYHFNACQSLNTSIWRLQSYNSRSFLYFLHYFPRFKLLISFLVFTISTMTGKERIRYWINIYYVRYQQYLLQLRATSRSEAILVLSLNCSSSCFSVYCEYTKTWRGTVQWRKLVNR